ncbi:protein of unknown function [Nitratireductor aquimarinus]
MNVLATARITVKNSPLRFLDFYYHIL